MSSDENNVRKYYDEFDDYLDPSTDKKATYHDILQQALDIRKFEIDLYWKRATYFWTSLGVFYTGYFTLSKLLAAPFHTLLVSSIILVFSIAWYCVNRGSKFWQENWECHIDLLEEKVYGPLYKTILYKRNSFFKFNSSYPFSVSKINTILSFFTIIISSLVFAQEVCTYFNIKHLLSMYNVKGGAVSCLAIIFARWMFLGTKCNPADNFFTKYENAEEDKLIIVKRDIPKISKENEEKS